MKTVAFFDRPLLKSAAFKSLKVSPGPGGDLLILPDIPAVSQARALFAGTESAPFITTFGHLSRKTAAASAARRLPLSRAGAMILMRRAAADLTPNEKPPRAPQIYQLLSLSADLKQHGITPEVFAKKTAGLPPETARKIRQTAKVLAEFERRKKAARMTDAPEMLEELARMFAPAPADTVDTISPSILSTVSTLSTAGVAPRRIIAAGFDRLTPLQERVLKAAAKSGAEVVAILCGGSPPPLDSVSEHGMTGGRLHRPPEGTAEDTSHRHSGPLHHPDPLHHSGPLRHSGESRNPEGMGQHPAVSFPTFTAEAEFAATEIRKLAENGTPPSECAVIMRDMSRAGEVAAAFERCGLAVHLRGGRSGASGISTLLKQFILTAGAGAGLASPEFAGLTRHPLMQNFLKSRRQSGAAELAELISRELPGNGAPPRESAVIEGLRRLVDATVISPGCAPAPPPVDSADKVDKMDGGFASTVSTGGGAGGANTRRLNEAREALREAAALCKQWDGVSSWEEIGAFVQSILESRPLTRKTNTSSPHVAVMDAPAARGASFSAVFVLNCPDGGFSRPLAGGPLGEDEKHAINRKLGAAALTTAAEHTEREQLIWNSVVACASGRLSVSFSGGGGASAILPASRYSPESAMAAEMARSGKIGGEAKKMLTGAGAFFELARYAVKGTAAENMRLRPEGEVSEFEGNIGAAPAPLDSVSEHGMTGENPRHPPDPSTVSTGGGRLRHPPEGAAGDTSPVIPAKAGIQWGWGGAPSAVSVGALESIGRCPFVFFCSRVLRLKEKPAEGRIPPPADTGALYHAALRAVFHGQGNGEQTEDALNRFLADDETKKAHCRVPEEVWELQKLRTAAVLRRFLAFENRRIKAEGLKPALFEEEIEMEISGAKVRGKLDRADIDETGGVRIVDYKKGGVDGTFCDRGRLQVPLYLRAAAEKLNAPPRGGDYLSVERPPERKSGGAEKCEDAVRFAESNLALAKEGLLPPFPLSKTDDFPYGGFFPAKSRMCEFCAYGDVCRIKSGVSRRAGGQ